MKSPKTEPNPERTKTGESGQPDPVTRQPSAHANPAKPAGQTKKVEETGGPAGPEPTRYGDWEVKGRCTDF